MNVLNFTFFLLLIVHESTNPTNPERSSQCAVSIFFLIENTSQLPLILRTSFNNFKSTFAVRLIFPEMPTSTHIPASPVATWSLSVLPELAPPNRPFNVASNTPPANASNDTTLPKTAQFNSTEKSGPISIVTDPSIVGVFHFQLLTESHFLVDELYLTPSSPDPPNVSVISPDADTLT